jgi:hypothetical protein
MEDPHQASQEEQEERWIQEVGSKGKAFCCQFRQGKFLIYPDRERDYWSGYFMSQIFDKALDPTLERVLFAAPSLGEPRRSLNNRDEFSVSLNAMMVSWVLPRIMWFVTTHHVFTMLLM